MPKTSFSRLVGSVFTGVILLAVPAFALCCADLEVFTPQAPYNAAVPMATDDSIVLTNWQFTGNAKPSKPTKPSKPSKKTDHKSKHTGH